MDRSGRQKLLEELGCLSSAPRFTSLEECVEEWAGLEGKVKEGEMCRVELEGVRDQLEKLKEVLTDNGFLLPRN